MSDTDVCFPEQKSLGASVISPKLEVYLPHVGWLRHPEADDVARFLAEGSYEYVEQAFFWLYLKAGDTVLDCGAHFGLYSALAGTLVGSKGRVVAIEPCPQVLPLLRSNIAAYAASNTVIVEQAMAATAERRGLYGGFKPGTAYSSFWAGESAGSDPGIQVQTSTLDTLLEEQQIAHVDFMKLDVEGAEMEVLRGAEKSIRAGGLPVIMVEVNELNLQRTGSTTEAFFAAIHALGYTLCSLDPQFLQLERHPYEGPIWYKNLFAVRDMDAVNHRLAEALPERRRIARDIIRRGLAAGAGRKKHEQLEKALADLNETKTQLEAGVETQQQKRIAAEARVSELTLALQDRDQKVESLLAEQDSAKGMIAQIDAALRATHAEALAAEMREKEITNQHGIEMQHLRTWAEAQVAESTVRLTRAQKSEESERQLRELVEEANQRILYLSSLLNAFCRSKYERLSWALHLRKKPDYVKAFEAQSSYVVDHQNSHFSGMDFSMYRFMVNLRDRGYRPRAILDVGAAKGYWSEFTGWIFPEAEFHMIDPLLESEPRLKEMCQRQSRFHYHLTAVGDEIGEVQMTVHAERPDSSTLVNDDAGNGRRVRLTTLDDLLATRAMPQPNLIKIDVQGLELAVLRGAVHVLTGADIVVVECNLYSFAAEISRVNDVIEFMSQRRFFIHDVAGMLRRPLDQALGQIDLVFVAENSPLANDNRWGAS